MIFPPKREASPPDVPSRRAPLPSLVYYGTSKTSPSVGVAIKVFILYLFGVCFVPSAPDRHIFTSRCQTGRAKSVVMEPVVSQRGRLCAWAKNCRQDISRLERNKIPCSGWDKLRSTWAS